MHRRYPSDGLFMISFTYDIPGNFKWGDSSGLNLSVHHSPDSSGLLQAHIWCSSVVPVVRQWATLKVLILACFSPHGSSSIDRSSTQCFISAMVPALFLSPHHASLGPYFPLLSLFPRTLLLISKVGKETKCPCLWSLKEPLVMPFGFWVMAGTTLLTCRCYFPPWSSQKTTTL